MKSVSLTAYPRIKTRRAGSQQLRRAGRIPAVIYGREVKAQNLELVCHEFEELIHHALTENLLLDLSVSEDSRPQRLALVQEIQHHPVNGRILHVDLHEVSDNEPVTVTVPVEAVGECAGVKAGGVLEHVRFSVRVKALPRDLPERLEADVTHLEIVQSVHIGDILPPPNVQILGDKNISLLSVAAPLTEAQALALEEAAAAASGEVEMIKEKKEEGEAAAAPATGKAGVPAPKGEAKTPATGADKPAEKKDKVAEKKK